MRLNEYLRKRGDNVNLAKRINAHVQDISDWKQGLRPVPVRHCVAIERATGGAVTRKDLRPNDWQDIWPELAEKGQEP